MADFIPLADYARNRGIPLSTLTSRISRGQIPADCIQRVGKTVIIRDQDYTAPTGNQKGAPRSGGGRKPKKDNPDKLGTQNESELGQK